MIRAILDSFPKQEDDVARWLAKHVAPPPLIMNVKSFHDPGCRQPNEVDFCPVDANFNEETEKEKNYRRWSLNYSDTLTTKDAKYRLQYVLPLPLEIYFAGWKSRQNTS